jgi:SAM-dependent methyltransferase
LRTADEFDAYYQSPDPWGIGNAWHRDKAFSRIIEPYVAGKSVLELGCGEGHLTASIFRDARNVKGVDISPIAVERAASLSLPNASFQASDFLNISFIGYLHYRRYRMSILPLIV